MQKGSVYKKKELLKLPSLKGQKKNKEEKKHKNRTSQCSGTIWCDATLCSLFPMMIGEREMSRKSQPNKLIQPMQYTHTHTSKCRMLKKAKKNLKATRQKSAIYTWKN